MITRMFVGVDISKRWFDACASLEGATSTRYLNTPEGHAQFIDQFRLKARKIHVCMEHTGGAEAPLAHACVKEGLAVSLVDGGAIASYRKSFGRAKAKTDREDARLLARFSQERKLPRWYPCPDEYRTLRELVRHREALIKARSAWGNRSSNAVENALVAAQRLTQCNVLALQVESIDTAIQDHIKSSPKLTQAMKLLVSIPGIAKVAGARILAETGPISSYKSAKEYALAAGLAPVVCHSGVKTPPGKLSVYGSAELRCAFYFPAMVCRGHKIGVSEFMDRVEANGPKLPITILTAGMRKLAHIVYGVLSTQTPYDQSKH